MSHETVRDLRKVGAAGAPRVRGPVRDRLSTEPEPDQDLAGESSCRGLVWRIAATVVIGLILGGIALLIASDDPALDCSALQRQSQYTSDVAAEIEAHCADLDPTVGP